MKCQQTLEKIIGAQPQPIESPKIPDPQMSAPALQGNLSEQTNANVNVNVNNIVTTPPDQPNPPRFTIILGTIAILIVAVIVFYYSSWTAQVTGTYLSQPVDSEPKESVTKQSNIEQPSERRLPFEPEMVRIPPGKFLMGSVRGGDEKKPQHEVTIAYAFEISKYEVTFDEYDVFAQVTNRKLPDDQDWGRGKRPVIFVSFNNAQVYVQWLSQQTGKKYRLPTEAEWEYAARAGTQTAYWWDNDIGQNNAVCDGCGSQWDSKKTAPVGSFKPNAFGLFDTAGNVSEWVDDCWHDNYQGAPADGSAWQEANGGDCNRRVVRGGSWDVIPQGLRSALRDWGDTGAAYGNLGFRIARVF